MKEVWKDIMGYEGLYQVSNLGRIKSLGNNKNKKEKIIKIWNDRNSYLNVVLHKKGVRKRCLVHRLVAETFISNPENKPEVNHKDCNRTNNIVGNLEWCTRRDNSKYPPTRIKRYITLIRRNYNNDRITCLLNELEQEVKKEIERSK